MPDLYYQRNKEKVKAKNCAWKEANREQYAAQQKAYRERTKAKRAEYWKKYYEEHRDECLAYYKQWQKNNPHKVLAATKAWQARNPDKVSANNREWHKRYPEKARVKVQNRRAKERSAEGSYTAAEWLELKKLYGGVCLSCGRHESERVLTADHVIPLAQGGSNYIINIQPLCGPCNSSKGARYIDYRLGEADAISDQV